MKTRFKLAAVAAPVLLLAGQAHAVLPADVTAAVGDMKADGVSIGVVVLGCVIAVLAIKFLRKAF